MNKPIFHIIETINQGGLVDYEFFCSDNLIKTLRATTTLTNVELRKSLINTIETGFITKVTNTYI